ncbi:glucosyltransferase [Longimycelium tulufanense]|uniref:Glucosyltransferase n=1 Tax=Longimycelium tulufanense TaxID=907463 RepID=A0A8J3CCB0_9PSEU|nr:glycosyltransferase family 4 protein [Longimycelium tulufanense]GGM47879.1 glucosyltransferase [Longimycelium tulufanense]
MRIAVVNNFFPPRPGGSSHLSEALARGYAAAGHEVLVLTAGYRDCPDVEARDGLRIVRLPSWTLPRTKLAVNFDIAYTLRPSLPRQVRRVLDDFGPDVVHQHGQFFDLTWVTGWWARRRGVPVLLSVHTRMESPKPLYQKAFRLGDGLLVHPILQRYRPRFVVMDSIMDAYIRARYRDAIRALHYIPVGVDPKGVSAGNAKLVRERHGLGDAPLIVSLGHVIPQRARLPLVRALPAILRQVPDLRVLVVGGVYYDEFLQLAEQLGVREAIVPVGAVPRAEVPHYLATAALEVHDLEGCGLGTASLESMAAGVPVVAAVRADNFPGIDLVDRKHLFQVPLGDDLALAETIIEIVRDPEGARAQVAEHAQQLIKERFTLDAVVDQHLAVFAEMVGVGR